MKKAIGIIFSLLIIYFLYKLLFWILFLFKNAQENVLVALIGAMTTVFVGLAVAIISQKYSKQRDVDESHRAKKVDIYKQFLNMVSNMLTKENEHVSIESISDQDLVNYLVEFKTDILLWGSSKVILRFLEFEKASQSGASTSTILIATNKFYRAIREDIGLSNKGLNNNELIKIFLKDPDELDEIIASNN